MISQSVRDVAPSHQTGQTAHPRRWWALGVLSLSLVIIGMDNTILNVAIPTLQQTFNASSSTLQWMVDAYILVFAGLLLTMGGLGDRFGRKRLLQFGLVIFAGAALMATYAGGADQLIAYRAIMGIGGAMIMPSTLSIIIDMFNGPERAKAIAIWAAVGGIGVGLGPLIGGALLENFWWGSVFLVNVPIAAIALVAGLALLPESKDPEPKPIDFAGAGLSTGAVSLLIFAIIEAPSRGWLAIPVTVSFAISLLMAAGFVLRETRARYPLLDFGFFKRPRFSAGAAVISVAFFALLSMMFGFTQYLQFVKGFSALEAGAGLLPIAAGLAISARLSEKFVAPFGTKLVVSAGLLILTLALLATTTVTMTTPYWQLGTLIFFVVVGMGAILAPATEAVMGAVPEHRAGVGSAMNDVTRQIAGAFGIAIVGSAMNAIYSNKMTTAVAGLPDAMADAAGDSVGAAIAIGVQLPGDAGLALTDAARLAFVDAFTLAVLISAGIALAGAVATLRFMPARGPESPLETPGEMRHETIIAPLGAEAD